MIKTNFVCFTDFLISACTLVNYFVGSAKLNVLMEATDWFIHKTDGTHTSNYPDELANCYWLAIQRRELTRLLRRNVLLCFSQCIKTNWPLTKHIIDISLSYNHHWQSKKRIAPTTTKAPQKPHWIVSLTCWLQLFLLSISASSLAF